MNKDYEIYDESNPEHNDPELYEVMETQQVLSVESVGTIQEDMKKRDFVNSCIYYSLKTKSLIDPSGDAITDCQNNVLRFMGKAKDRLSEDNIRGWRFYKFVARGWEPELKSLKAVRESWDSIYKNSNPERVRRELESMIGM